MEQQPYIEKVITVVERHYNPSYGNGRLCKCGHTYYRHFDTYEVMADVGCKYCGCGTFKEFTGNINEVVEWVKVTMPEEYLDLQSIQKEYNLNDSWFHEKCLELKYKHG